jgi:phosphoadenosine phosphosulfate reductase
MTPSSSSSRTRAVDAARRLANAVARHAPAAFSTSLQREDMVILDLVVAHALPVEVFTLDTGRLHEETHAFIERVREHYGTAIRVLAPDARAVEAFTTAHGTLPFHRSRELRLECCAIRKSEPLTRALAGKGLWITGLRRGQSAARAETPILESDPKHGLMKLAPIADWSDDDVDGYLARHDVPVHPLHARGYPSIGCAPCTRPVATGADPRSGRWWWEADGARECGLHVDAHGRLVRARPREDVALGDTIA